MTDASIGYKSQFWLTDPETDTLVKLGEVRRIGMPTSGAFDEVEATHLDSPDRWREYVRTFRTDQRYEVELNYVPNSETDQIIRALAGLPGVFPARIVEFDGYTAVATHDFDVQSVQFTISDIETETIKTQTVSYRVASQVESTFP